MFSRIVVLLSTRTERLIWAFDLDRVLMLDAGPGRVDELRHGRRRIAICWQGVAEAPQRTTWAYDQGAALFRRDETKESRGYEASIAAG